MAQKKPNQKVNQNWSWYKIRKLETLSTVGDTKATEELRLYNNRLAREANFRLRQLASAGIKKYGYEKAQSFLTNMFGDRVTRYKQNLSEPDAIRRQILSMQRFLEYPTSTVEGVKLIETKRLQAAKAKWFTDENGQAMATDEDIDAFLRMLGDDAIRRTILEEGLETDETLKMTSGDVVDLIRGKFQTDDKEVIINEFRKYQEFKESQGLGLNTAEPYYYDDLMDYLRGGK